MIVCKDLFEKMSEFLDGEMDLAMIEEAEGHLSHCIECKETLEVFRKSVALLKKAKIKKMSENDKNRLRDLIHKEMDKL